MSVLTRPTAMASAKVLVLAALLGGGFATPTLDPWGPELIDGVIESLADQPGVGPVSEAAAPVVDHAVRNRSQSMRGVVVDEGADPDLRLVDPSGTGLSVEGGLPGRMETSRNGASVYVNDTFAAVPLAYEDGSVQIINVLRDSQSPTRYDYTLTSAEPLVLEPGADGGVLITTVDGDFVGGAATPWAYDSEGMPVPTWFEVKGNQLTQVVDHSSGAFSYPVTADPWLGINLFQYATVTKENGQSRVNLLPSGWGASMWTTISGHAIMNTAGWDEVRSRWSSVRAALDGKSSMRQQYECHVAGSPFTGGWWNLERWRPTRTVHWSYGVAIHECNWVSATRY